MTALYKQVTGVTVPPDPKGSSVAMAALEKEKDAPQADMRLLLGRDRLPAAQKGLHEPYKPAGLGEDPRRPQGPERPLVDGPHQHHRLRRQHQGARRRAGAAVVGRTC